MPLIITTVNVNGIRAATKERSETNKGFLEWIKSSKADHICLQETRADDQQLREALAPALAQGWHLVSAEPIVKGRNGVAILSREPADAIRIGFGNNEFAQSGRYIEADFGKLTVASLYLPSGETDTPRQEEKERFMAIFAQYLTDIGRKRRQIVVSGDWNIAHTERDLKNWKTNKKSSGFLPEERQWMGEVFGTDSAWVDVVRQLHPEIEGPYTWWSFRGKAFDNDSGWRIDYQVANKALAKRAQAARVERADSYDLRWSDHSPVTVEYS
ncbi:MAG: exodeoxyribonuclease III [Mycobacteriaceae bacterium]